MRKTLLPFIPFTSVLAGVERLGVTSQQRRWSEPSLSSLGSSFLEIWDDSKPDTVISLLQVICHMRDFTIIIENYMEGRAVKGPPIVLTDQRNFTQHRLMDLPTLQEINSRGHEAYDQQYDSCRLACIAYSFLVIFPFPPTVGLFERLSMRLRKSLLNEHLPSYVSSSREKLKLWILSMGAIISIGLPQRDWFLHELRPLISSLRLESANQLAETLRGFLWHPTTSESDGVILWHDLQSLNDARIV